jgi:tyrosine-protein kinase Etk/Wzc
MMPVQTNDRETISDKTSAYQELEYEGLTPAIFRSLIVLAKRKTLILLCSGIVVVSLTVIALCIPNEYTATARILPPQNQQSGAANMLAGQLAPLAALMGRDSGIKNPVDLYLGLAKSATIADQLIKDFNLREVYRDKTLFDTREDLSQASDIFAGKDGIIVISVVDKDPKRAAALADAYVKALSGLNEKLTISEASQRRLFYESQLKSEKDRLVEAELALRKTQEVTGVIQLADQAKTIIETVAKMRATIAAKEVEIQTMKVFATDRNPQLLAAQQERSALVAQLARLERDEKSGGNGDLSVPTGKVPEVGLEYVRAYRDVKYHEALFEMLAKQAELARIDEARSSAFIQVLDTPVIPDKKSAPHRGYIIVLGTLATFLLVCFWVLMVENINRSAEHRRLVSDFLRCLWPPVRQS